MQLSTGTVASRGFFVLEHCRQRNIAVAAVIGGGYERDFDALTAVHLQLFIAAFTLSGTSLGREMIS
ncbi:hypothetical protein [Alishewanella longhuensis]